MFSIGYIIYGVPLTEEIDEKINEWEEDLDTDLWWEDEDGPCGFQTVYSGDAPGRVGWCGVELGQVNAFGYQSMSEVAGSVTNAQVQEALKKIEALHPELRALCPEIGPWIVWGTS